MSRSCTLHDFVSYAASLPPLLDAIGAREVFAAQERILLKPNLVNKSPYPVTLPLEAMRVLVEYVRSCSDAALLIGEGTGELGYDTYAVFDHHGYMRLAEEFAVTLVDLNEVENRLLENPACEVFPTFYLPKIALESFVVSFPVLKAHSLADVTLSMKNMMGLPSHRHYQQGGAWRKSFFHRRMHRSIFELNLYRKPDLAIIDASLGLAEYHLGGPTCDPPVAKLVGGFDPVAVDACGAGLLGFDWHEIEHIRLADGVLGQAAEAAPIAASVESPL